MKNFFSFKCAFLILALTLLAATGCKKDSPEPSFPQVISTGISGPDTTISVGSTITLTPIISNPNNISGLNYAWTRSDNAPMGENKPLVVTAARSESITYRLDVWNDDGRIEPQYVTIHSKYTGPFFIVNEGSYGRTMGSLTRVNTNATPVELTFNAYATLNGGKTLGNTTCYATRIADTYFFISKQGNRVVSTDLNLAQKGISTLITSNTKIDGRAITGISATEGVITTSKGAFKIALNLSDLGNALTPLAGTENKQCGDILFSKPYLYIATTDNKALVYNADKGLALEKTIDNIGAGFVQTPDGRIWGALNNTLTSIDAKTLATQTYSLPDNVNIYPTWGAWKPMAGMCAHPTKNIIFFPNYASGWGGGNQIYKFNAETSTSFPELIYTGTTDDHFYGSGLGIDPVTHNLVANFCTVSWGNDKNSVVVINTDTNKEIQRTPYEGYYFPEMFLFYNNDKK